MYEYQHQLRQIAQTAIVSKGYKIEGENGAIGARFFLTKSGKRHFALIRTSRDRWVGWMRKEGEFKGFAEASLVVIAVLDRKDYPTKAEVFAFEPGDVHKAFKANAVARQKANESLSENSPIFVCLDEAVPGRAASVGSNLKAKALWCAEIALQAAGTVSTSVKPKETTEIFAARVRQEFADLIGVPVDKVSVDIKVSL